MRPCEVGRGDEEDGRFRADPTLSKGGDGRVDSIVGVERNQGGCRLTAKGGGGGGNSRQCSGNYKAVTLCKQDGKVNMKSEIVSGHYLPSL